MSESKKTDVSSKVGSQSEKLKSRRKAVRAIVIGGGAVTGAKSLPSEWAAPVVNSVVLPSHADTTDLSDSSGTDNTTTTTTTTTTTLCPSGYYYHPQYYSEGEDDGCRPWSPV